jgi:hypothetical protein
MMQKSRFVLATALAIGVAAGGLPAAAQAILTKVMVRAVSRDAKVIQDPVGGARITIRDVATGNVLAQGVQQGRSGNTELIMVKPRARGATVFDTPGTAGFLATLMLERPTVVEITAEGPLGNPQATQRASKTLLLVPGQHVLGEGVLLEIHGFIVDLLAPVAGAEVRAGQPLPVRVKVTMT